MKKILLFLSISTAGNHILSMERHQDIADEFTPLLTQSIPERETQSGRVTPTALQQSIFNGATATVIARDFTTIQQIIPNQPPIIREYPLILISSQGENNPTHVIQPEAIKHSATLTQKIKSGANSNLAIPLAFNIPNDHIFFITELLNNIAQYRFTGKYTREQQKHFHHYIRTCIHNHTRNFETISFIDTINLLAKFDISFAIDAITEESLEPLTIEANQEQIHAHLMLAYAIHLKGSMPSSIALKDILDSLHSLAYKKNNAILSAILKTQSEHNNFSFELEEAVEEYAEEVQRKYR